MAVQVIGTGRYLVAARCRRVLDSGAFNSVVLGLILANAALLGLETYDGISRAWHHALATTEHVFLVAFTVELLVRFAAHLDRPADFLRDPWNLFDAALILLAVSPLASQNATALRMLRLARVLRAARLMPQLRIILVAVGKSVPGTVSFMLVGTLLLYVYAMVGWLVFGDVNPDQYGSLGRATLTLFLLMTLDGLGDAVAAGMAYSPWTIVYFASFVLLGSFVMVNLLIGVVLNSLEEAREMEAEAKRAPAAGDPEALARKELTDRIQQARTVLGDLELMLAEGRTIPAQGPEPDGHQEAHDTALAGRRSG
ncbi:ion transporter [Streptomyces sp. NPDC001941]|uniref:ion transporter n=1 Tax=Streptomyces sp. NPDC001941 TaxID=3154659 RepID=UPI00331B98CB